MVYYIDELCNFFISGAVIYVHVSLKSYLNLRVFVPINRFKQTEALAKGSLMCLPGPLSLSQNKPWFLRVCSGSLSKTPWEKEKLLVTSNFSFSHRVFYP